MTINDKNGVLKGLTSRPQVKIELGVGLTKMVKDSVAIDKHDSQAVDIVANLEAGLSFLPEKSVDEVHSYHFLEHIGNVGFLLQEIHRVLKVGGKNIGTVPHFSNPYFYSDYTHRSAWGLYSFCYLSNTRYFRREVPRFYNQTMFKINRIDLTFKSPFRCRHFVKSRLVQPLINSSKYLQELYEECFCYLCPAYDVRFETEKIE